MSERTKILDFPKSVVSPGTSGPAISARTDSITWPARHSRVERPNTSNWTLSVTSLATRRPVDGTVPGKAPDVRDICGRPGQWRCAVFGDFCARVHPNRLTCRLTVALASNVSYSELYMGSFCLTQSNPTHQLTEPTQQYKCKNLDPTQYKRLNRKLLTQVSNTRHYDRTVIG